MPGHFTDFINEGNQSSGLLIVPQAAPVADIIESILLIWTASDADEWADRVAWLPL